MAKSKEPKQYDRITIYFDPENKEHQAVYKKIMAETGDQRKCRSSYIIRKLIESELVDSEKVNDRMVKAIVEQLKPLLANLQATKSEPENTPDAALECMDDVFGNTMY